MRARPKILRLVVVVGGLLLFVLLVLWLSRRGPLFTLTYRLNFEFDSVAGLEPQSKVLMRGYPIGQVRGISFVPGGIVVAADIERKYAVPEGSAVAVETYSLLGERAINITPSASPRRQPPGSLLHGEDQDLLATLRTALSEISQSRQAFDGSRLERTLDLADETFAALKRALSGVDLARVSAELKDAVQAAREIRDDIRQASERFGALSDEGRSALARFEKTLEAADRTQAAMDRYLDRANAESESAASLLNDKQFITSFKDVLAELDDFFKEIKKNPKKYFKFSLF